MSGQQIGTVIGGVAGAFFGGPAGAQIGMAIGGLIGGVVDPTKINGPHIGDGQQQAATDGAPIAWVMGTATVAGTIIDVGPRREVKIKDSGKGGPEVSHYEARQDFAILVCESSEIRGSTISNVLIVEQDGKIVYDVRTGSTILEDSAKWKANVDFLFGAETQMPHATLEAIHGVGNTPAYRGSLLAVFKDFNLTQAGDRIPTFRFTVSSIISSIQLQWAYKQIASDDATDYSGDTLDYSTWSVGRAPFGSWEPGYGAPDIVLGAPDDLYAAHTYDARFVSKFATFWENNTRLWLRGKVYLAGVNAGDYTVTSFIEDNHSFYVNGALIYTTPANPIGGSGVVHTIAASNFREGENTIAVRCDDEAPGAGISVVYADFVMEPAGATNNAVPLSSIIAMVCERGGLTLDDIDVTDAYGTYVLGYPIAKQCTAVDALLPLLNAYFAYGSEYDAKLNFKFYGADAAITIDDDDLLEGNDANDDAVTANLRNNATEFPLRMIGSYFDPAQNYMPVTVMQSRRAADVIAIGDAKLDIPVVMAANDAQQAVDKAMKVAYARLEGTLDYSVPFGGTASYLTLCAGESVIYNGKRWALDGITISQGYLKLATRYDRQSAYISTVQAIEGVAPTAPTSRYSGPTTLVAMNLPSLRPQDTYGVYLAAASSDGRTSWRGCTVQVSFDDAASWQNALDITTSSVMGALTAADTGTELDAQMNGDVSTVTSAQLDAQANPFALVHDDTHTEVGQIGTATESGVTDNLYAFTELRRGLKTTTQITGVVGDKLIMLDNVYFFPVDASFKGTTLKFRAVGFGEVAEDAAVVAFDYEPDDTVILDGNGT